MTAGELWRRLCFLLRRKQRLRELEEEMRLHEQLRREQIGSSASRQFGNFTSFKESVWDFWSFNALENVWRDLRFGFRTLTSTPGFTIIAVLTLALGIGATTAMFSVIDNVMLEPFPYADQHRIYSVVFHDLSSNEAGDRTMFPAPELLDYQQAKHVFTDVMGVGISRASWITGGAPESINAPLVTANAFQFLGVDPILGRYATPDDTKPGASPVCVMSYAFWKSRFSGNSDVLGKTLVLDGLPRTVIGVMPERFGFWSADVWLPTTINRATQLLPPWYYLLGRLRPGLSTKDANHELQMLAERIAPSYRPNLYTNHFEVRLQSFADAATQSVGRTLYSLLAAVGLLLLIACANVANLLLARAGTRKRELAVRTSLGAGWARILRQLFMESAVLAVLGAGVGCAVAWSGLRLLVAILPSETFPDEAVIGLNLRVLLATVAVTVGTALFFGLIPLLGGLRQDINDALKSGGRQLSGFGRGQTSSLLIVCEVAVSLVLLCAAGVTIRSFLLERQIQLGLSPTHVLSAQVFLTKNRRSVEQQTRFMREFTAGLRTITGVQDVATTTDFLPFGGATTELTSSTNIHTGQAEGQFALVDPDIFHTLKVPLNRGRNFTETDITGKHMVAIVNQSLVKKFFPDLDPIGQHIDIGTLAHLPQPVPNPRFEIVGVVADFKNRGIRHPVSPEAYIPYTVSGLGGFEVMVRTAGNPEILSRTIEKEALILDASTVVRHIRTVEEALEAEVYAKPRFGLRIFAVFAALGVLLVSTGLYSVTAYTVSQRKREMGIRLALGATRRDVQALVIGREMRFVAIGIVAGLVLSFAALQALASQLWGISTHDPITLGSVVLILLVVGACASYVPSLTATRVDPAETLRAE
ncbi:MAG TPA: ABC transporter permease [Bryobacteraceae bacterium]|nr:ABC transporter permease [Bryobacteraceae bacterium]